MIIAIRVRGSVHVNRKARHTLEMLRLLRSNHAALVDGKQGRMVESVKDFVAFGEATPRVVALLLEKRGKLAGGRRLTREFVAEKGFESAEKLAEEIIAGRATLKGLGIKPVFRLKPPTKGHARRGIKKPYKLGGALGNYGEKIGELVVRMA